MTTKAKQPKVITNGTITLGLASAEGLDAGDVNINEEEGEGDGATFPQLPGILPIHYVAVCVL